MMRYLALDVGDERIGVAVSDAGGMVARPLEVIPRRRGKASFLRVRELVEAYHVGVVVVGWPLLPNGTEGEQVRSTVAYMEGLARYVDVPILRYDERDSTAWAADLAQTLAKSRTRRKNHRDALAAAVILQGFLNEMAEGQGA